MAMAATKPDDTYPWLASYPEGLNWHQDLPARALPDLLDDAVAKYGHRPAIDFLDRKWSYAQLGRAVDSLAAGLQARGLQKGDRVGLLMPNCPWFVIAYFGVLKAGGIVVNCNPLYSTEKLAQQIEDSGTRFVFTLDLKLLFDKAEALLEQVGGLEKLVVCPFADALPWPKNWGFRLARRKDLAAWKADAAHMPVKALMRGGKPEPVAINPISDVAVLQYTGGTTGEPKGAMLTHANIYANVMQCAHWYVGVTPGQERTLGVLPLFHVFAMTGVMCLSVHFGCEIILLPQFDLKQMLKTIHGKKPTMMPAVPSMFSTINSHRDRSKYDLTSIKWCISGGAPLPVDVREQFIKLTGCKLFEGYGLTESSPVAVCNPLEPRPEIGYKEGSIGMPLPGTIVEIVSLDDQRTVLGIGQKGELCLIGPQVMKGYWNNPEATAETLIQGKLHTGDVAIMDDDGYIFIVDRIKDLILAGGYNVYPRNVEEAIYRHPAVEECVVGGIPHDHRGEMVKAWVKLVEGASLSAAELKEFLTDKLSPIELPKQIEFRDRPLPKTMVGKLSRKDLVEEEKARLAQKAARRAARAARSDTPDEPLEPGVRDGEG